MIRALFLNGVYQDVLDEIVQVQTRHTNQICYLQPYDSRRIVELANSQPTPDTPVTIYISTTGNLNLVSYQGQVVGWENKRELDTRQIAIRNVHMKKFQPQEAKIHLQVNGKDCINLIHVQNLSKLNQPFSVTNLVKSDPSWWFCLCLCPTKLGRDTNDYLAESTG